MKTPGREVLQSLRKKMPAAEVRKIDRLTERSNGKKPIGLTSITYKTLSLPGVRIHPTFDRVLVEYEEDAGQTKGGIIIPNTAQTRKSGGSYPVRVLAVGPGRWRQDPPGHEDVTALLHILNRLFENDFLATREENAFSEIRDRYTLWLDRIPMAYQPGDRAMAPCLNFPLYMDGREVYLCNEDALLGKLE